MALRKAFERAAPRPADTASQSDKKNYSERLSNEVARVLAGILREHGVAECEPGERKGRERQFAGGIGAKKVDVSFATETAGLILGVSIKSICFPDPKTNNFSKNLTNRRGDLLAEATTLHQRFPYAVLGGLFIFDDRAEEDGTGRRSSTLRRALEIFSGFTNRTDRSNSVEKYEAFGIVTFSSKKPYQYKYYDIKTGKLSDLNAFISALLQKIAERNPDHYQFTENRLIKI